MKRLKYITLLILAAFALNGSAQTAKSAYFLDGTFHNFKLNPAMQAERGFFSFGVGNMTIGTNSNVGISNFLYPHPHNDNQLMSFMSSEVGQDEFLSNLPESIRLGMNFDETLLAFGFRMFGGYTSFSLSMHANTSFAMPKGFFEFAKTGLQQSSFDFSGINMNMTSYAAATLGYSHEVYKGLRVGVNLKYLIGLAYLDATFDRFNIELSEQRWMVEAHAKAQAALFGEVYYDGENSLDNLKFGSFAPSSNGFAVDLGVVYDMKEFVPGLTLSASLLDLGKINWKYTMSLENDGTPLVWTGLNDIDLNDMGSALESELDKLGEDAEKMMEFKINDIESTSAKLGATMYLGAEYNMPFYNPLSVAVLYGKKFSTYSGWNEVRGFVNFAPLKWLEASANIGKTTFGTSWGWMFNFHPGFTSFFIGSDYMISKVTPQFLPVNDLNYHITFGINMPIGKRISDKNKKRQSEEPTTIKHSVQNTIIYNYNNIILPVSKVELNESVDTLTAVNETLQLTAVVTPNNATNKAVTWSSSNDSVATVDNNGFVTAVGNGIAIITATAEEQTATCEITVAIEATEKVVDEVAEEVTEEVVADEAAEEVTEEVTENTTEESTEEATETSVTEDANADSSLQ